MVLPFQESHQTSLLGSLGQSLLELCYAKHCAKSINQIVITESWDDRGGFSVVVVSKDPGVLLCKFAHPPGSPPPSITTKSHASVIALTDHSICLSGHFLQVTSHSYVFSDHIIGREVQRELICVGWSGEDECHRKNRSSRGLHADRARAGQRGADNLGT